MALKPKCRNQASFTIKKFSLLNLQNDIIFEFWIYGRFAIYMKKDLKAKEELWKFKNFTMQKYNLQKKSSKIN